MLKGYWERYFGKNNRATIRIWFICALFFSCFYVNAQQTNPKPAAKPKKDTTHKSATHRIVVPVKKDSTHHRVVKKDSLHVVNKPIVNSIKKDTARKKGTVATVNHRDSLSNKKNVQGSTVAPGKKVPFVRKKDPLWEKTLEVPYLPLKAKPIYVMDEPHPYESKDILFFTVCGLFFIYGIIRTAFPKYTGSLFRNLVSFSSIDKSDYNMGQNNLPSLLLNILFCLSVGLLAALMLEEIKDTTYPIWQVWLAGSLVLAVIYFVKFVTIYTSGWIFNASTDANAYMYVVFMINKVIGVLSLPAILVFAFAENPVLNSYIVTIGGILLIVLLLYRYVVTFSVIARNLQLNALHFFLYLCSVEIIPILVLYKLFSKDLVNWI